MASVEPVKMYVEIRNLSTPRNVRQLIEHYFVVKEIVENVDEIYDKVSEQLADVGEEGLNDMRENFLLGAYEYITSRKDYEIAFKVVDELLRSALSNSKVVKKKLNLT